MSILNGGNVGIGTTNPISKLDVNGGLCVGTCAGTTAAPANGLLVSGAAKFNNTIQTATILTVATLSTCNAGAEGTMSAVSDALAPAFLATVVGGGAVHTAVYCDGTNWKAN